MIVHTRSRPAPLISPTLRRLFKRRANLWRLQYAAQAKLGARSHRYHRLSKLQAPKPILDREGELIINSMKYLDDLNARLTQTDLMLRALASETLQELGK